MPGIQPKTTKCAKNWDISAQNEDGKYESSEINQSMTQLLELSSEYMKLVVITWCHMLKILRLCVLHGNVGVI